MFSPYQLNLEKTVAVVRQKILEKWKTWTWKQWPHGLYIPWNSPGQNTGVGSLSLLQRIFPTQWLNPGVPYSRQILYLLNHKRSPGILEWVAYPIFSGSSWLRNQTGASCTAGGFFTNWAIRRALKAATNRERRGGGGTETMTGHEIFNMHWFPNKYLLQRKVSRGLSQETQENFRNKLIRITLPEDLL